MFEITMKALKDTMLDWFETVQNDDEFNTKVAALGMIEKTLDEIGALTWHDMIWLEEVTFG